MGLRRQKRSESDEVIDLTNEGVAPSGDRLVAGVPGRCPACDGYGFLDHIDMRNHFQVQHCRDCGHQWEYTFDEDGMILGLSDGADTPVDR